MKTICAIYGIDSTTLNETTLVANVFRRCGYNEIVDQPCELHYKDQCYFLKFAGRYAFSVDMNMIRLLTVEASK